jgi:RNA polymerase sigma-70 factor (ECF subfamily)
MQQPDRALLTDAPGRTLYESFAPAIFAYLLKQTASREDAEDLLLEVFLAGLEQGRLARIDEAKQGAWLWGVARHKAADYFRQRSRQPRVDLSLVTETASDRKGTEPEQMLLQQEEFAQLAEAIRKLPAQQQDVIHLRFGHDLSYDEMATILQKRTGTVRMLLSRALRALRGAYQRTER